MGSIQNRGFTAWSVLNIYISDAIPLIAIAFNLSDIFSNWTEHLLQNQSILSDIFSLPPWLFIARTLDFSQYFSRSNLWQHQILSDIVFSTIKSTTAPVNSWTYIYLIYWFVGSAPVILHGYINLSHRHLATALWVVQPLWYLYGDPGTCFTNDFPMQIPTL